MEFHSHTLENGLEIVAECNDEAVSTAVGFFVRTGARDECDEIAGVSHFLEHMCFKGTPRRTANDVNREFDEMGAHHNAFTSEESTVYYASVLPEYLDASLDLLADIMRPSLRQHDFDMEKKVILEEIEMYLDQPPFGMDDRIKELHLPGHPIAHSVLGTENSIAALRREQMQSYFEARYSPRNVFVAAAGKVSFTELVDSVARRCAGWIPTDALRETPMVSGRGGFDVVHREATKQQYILQLADAPPSEASSRFAAKLLVTILGDDSGSRMYWEITDPGLAESASLGHYEFQGIGMYFAWVACEPSEAEANLRRLDAIYRTAEKDGISSQELALAKNKVKSRVVLSSERPRSRLFSVGGNWLQRREYRAVTDDLAAVDAVTLDDLHAVLAEYPISNNTTITVGPLTNVNPPS